MKLQDLQTIQTCHWLSKDVENIWKQKHSAVALPSKPDHWNPDNKYMQIWKKNILLKHVNLSDAKLSKQWQSTQKSALSFRNSPSTCSKKSPRSTMNDKIIAPPKRPNLSLSKDAGKVWESDIMTCRSIQRSPSHTPGLCPLGTNVVQWQINVRDGRVCLQCLGQGLEAATDQGWRLDF